MTLHELNIDGIIGPTHNYAGLSRGNLASQVSVGKPSSPRRAVLQGLEKMRLIMSMGVPQAVLPPQDRPHLAALRRLGFTGSDADIIARSLRDAPHLTAAAFSASSMWAANAATVSPSCDSADGRVHFTPANLVFNFHRSLEADFTSKLLRRIFPGRRFVHHEPLPAAINLRDEGAANHMRLASASRDPRVPVPRGLQVFVFGDGPAPGRGSRRAGFTARQTLDASLSVARLHEIAPSHVLYLRQHPGAIDAGVFHNDVIATSHEDLLLVHEDAYAERDAIDMIRKRFGVLTGHEMNCVVVRRRELSLRLAVESYLFNSQIVTDVRGRRIMICPVECRESESVSDLVRGRITHAAKIDAVRFVDLRQSMDNGGGPACLRLRVPLTPRELASVHAGVMLTPSLHRRLVEWGRKHFRDSLSPADIADPALWRESRDALDELTRILRLGSIYGFQR